LEAGGDATHNCFAFNQRRLYAGFGEFKRGSQPGRAGS
jgi:hypothetical protein